jgi:hypothetical protein
MKLSKSINGHASEATASAANSQSIDDTRVRALLRSEPG